MEEEEALDSLAARLPTGHHLQQLSSIFISLSSVLWQCVWTWVVATSIHARDDGQNRENSGGCWREKEKRGQRRARAQRSRYARYVAMERNDHVRRFFRLGGDSGRIGEKRIRENQRERNAVSDLVRYRYTFKISLCILEGRLRQIRGRIK